MLFSSVAQWTNEEVFGLCEQRVHSHLEDVGSRFEEFLQFQAAVSNLGFLLFQYHRERYVGRFNCENLDLRLVHTRRAT